MTIPEKKKDSEALVISFLSAEVSFLSSETEKVSSSAHQPEVSFVALWGSTVWVVSQLASHEVWAPCFPLSDPH